MKLFNVLQFCGRVARSDVQPVEEFRKLELVHKKKTFQFDRRPKTFQRSTFEKSKAPREKSMSVEQDWPSVWPTASTFRSSTVPLPIRMGYQKNPQVKPPPQKVGNLELMKIPNFLHLTPPAIQRHCEALKKFCTPWPEQLGDDESMAEYCPLEFITNDYCHAGPSIRDPRSRIVTVKFKVGNLPLNEHAKDKMKRILSQKRYEKELDLATIVTDRCPARHQNKDYSYFLLTAAFHESWKTEPWETDKSRRDTTSHEFSGSLNKLNLILYFDVMIQKYNEMQDEAIKASFISRLPSGLRTMIAESKEVDVNSLSDSTKFITAWEAYKNDDESEQLLDDYAKNVRTVLEIPNVELSS